MTFDEKLKQFIHLLQDSHDAWLYLHGWHEHPSTTDGDKNTYTFTRGHKYIKIKLGPSVLLFVDKKSEIIYLSRSYQGPNLKHNCGTLDDIWMYAWHIPHSPKRINCD